MKEKIVKEYVVGLMEKICDEAIITASSLAVTLLNMMLAEEESQKKADKIKALIVDVGCIRISSKRPRYNKLVILVSLCSSQRDRYRQYPSIHLQSHDNHTSSRRYRPIKPALRCRPELDRK